MLCSKCIYNKIINKEKGYVCELEYRDENIKEEIKSCLGFIEQLEFNFMKE